MRKLTLLVALTIAGSAMASEELIITTTEGGDGYRDVQVERTARPVPSAANSFAEADQNGDGCVDRNEARDAGILGFDKWAKTRKGCLTPEEYQRAMSADSK